MTQLNEIKETVIEKIWFVFVFINKYILVLTLI